MKNYITVLVIALVALSAFAVADDNQDKNSNKNQPTSCQSGNDVKQKSGGWKANIWDTVAKLQCQVNTLSAKVDQLIKLKTGPKGDTGKTGPAGSNGKGVVSDTKTIAPGAICVAGGVKTKFYTDANNNGKYDWQTDINKLSESIVCNGPEGEQGAKGDSGATGATGPQGETGPQGIQGEQGDKGDNGDQGIQGIPGPIGETGAAGATGSDGAQGVPGETGATGPEGPQGEKGDKGDKGDTGDAGAQGIQGETGLPGPAGDTGPVGPAGDTGPMGPQGVPGEAGVPGDAGAQGPIGEQGPIGLTGAQGDIGAQGIPGDTGPTGPQGDKGDKGDTGDAGPQGPTGDIGPTGPTGPAGIAGLERIVVTSANDPSSPKTITVECSAGKKALGGGISSSETTGTIMYTANYPSSDDEWTVTAYRSSGAFVDWTLTGYILCADLSEEI